MYKMTDEASLRAAIDVYMKFKRRKTAVKISLQNAAGSTKRSISCRKYEYYLLAKNRSIEAYKVKWCA